MQSTNRPALDEATAISLLLRAPIANEVVFVNGDGTVLWSRVNEWYTSMSSDERALVDLARHVVGERPRGAASLRTLLDRLDAPTRAVAADILCGWLIERTS